MALFVHIIVVVSLWWRLPFTFSKPKKYFRKCISFLGQSKNTNAQLPNNNKMSKHFSVNLNGFVLFSSLLLLFVREYTQEKDKVIVICFSFISFTSSYTHTKTFEVVQSSSVYPCTQKRQTWID